MIGEAFSYGDQHYSPLKSIFSCLGVLIRIHRDLFIFLTSSSTSAKDVRDKETVARINFTTGRLTAFTCPLDKAQAFIWDTGVIGLGVRATPRGAPSYVFQREFQGKSPRITIGAVADWTISAARERARRRKPDNRRPGLR
ncbi:integrase arm-type DNA-binding domain-containing protein [Variovorax sp. CF313]|uniref:integrase arm-type DNA-binding domain-containing protein n=1 Tax=Variovorax sp. CF313 TaxID=1144315 RepID=UPI00307A6446